MAIHLFPGKDLAAIILTGRNHKSRHGPLEYIDRRGCANPLGSGAGHGVATAAACQWSVQLI